MPSPLIAVVIPTYRREARLRFALDALMAQSMPRTEFEVVVVRAPSSTPRMAERPAGLTVRFLQSGRAGAAAQRNTGWRSTTAPYIAFLDDDCRPSPRWLEALASASEGGTVLQGRTEPDPDELHLLYGLARTMTVTGLTDAFPSCNILYPRALLERLGGFDEDFERPWGEDTDLGQRALLAGAKASYASDALAWHAVLPNPLPDALRHAARRRWLPWVIKRHPQLRRSLVARLFVNRAHATLAIAATGFLLGGRRLRRAALAPYLGHVLVQHAAARPVTPRSLARLAVHLPARLAVDVTEVAATVEGSARARTPVV